MKKAHTVTLIFMAGLLCVGVVYIGVILSRPGALIEAAYRGDADEVRRYLDLGVSPHVRDGWSSTPLMYAAGGGHLEMVLDLLEAGVPVDERSRINRTPLMWAAYDGHMDVVKYLLDRSADPDLYDREGMTAADLAKKNSHSEIVSLLVMYDQNSKNAVANEEDVSP